MSEYDETAGKIEHHWRGRPLSELSREDLIEALEYCGDRLHELNSPTMIQARAIGRAEMFKRAVLPPLINQV